MARYQEKEIIEKVKTKAATALEIALFAFLVAVIIGVIVTVIVWFVQNNKTDEETDDETEKTTYADVYEDIEHVTLDTLEAMLETGLNHEKRKVLTYVFIYSPDFESYRSSKDMICIGESDEVQGAVKACGAAMKEATPTDKAFYIVNILEEDEDGNTYDSSFLSNYSISVSKGVCLVVIDNGEISTYTTQDDINTELTDLVTKLQ